MTDQQTAEQASAKKNDELEALKKQIMSETHLGDGLYASFDGYQVKLRAPREFGDHEVFLEPGVLDSFKKWEANLKKQIEEYHSAFYDANVQKKEGE